MAFLGSLVLPILAGLTLVQGQIAQRQDASPSSSASQASSSASQPSAPSTNASGSTSALPNLSSTSAAPAPTKAPGGITNAPTLTDGPQTYSYPPPSVPPTADAPFMRKSTLPNGTVFICVGAILGGFFVAVIVWRAWAAWALHRRMNAANADYVGLPSAPPKVTGSGIGPDRKAAVLRKSSAGFYSQNTGSGYNMGDLKKAGFERKSDYPPGAIGGSKNAAATRQSSLFFSPTAGAGAHGTAAQRASSYLPAGYYAAGSTVGSTVVNASSTSDLNASRSQLSMSDFSGPPRQTYGYKDSPVLRAQSGSPALEPPNAPFGRHSIAGTSTSSLGAGSDRAPSAYLEDLFNTAPTEQRGSDERRRY